MPLSTQSPKVVFLNQSRHNNSKTSVKDGLCCDFFFGCLKITIFYRCKLQTEKKRAIPNIIF